jgi:hypothetical protein
MPHLPTTVEPPLDDPAYQRIVEPPPAAAAQASAKIFVVVPHDLFPAMCCSIAASVDTTTGPNPPTIPQ